MSRIGAKAVPAFVVISLILATPLLHKLYVDFPWTVVDHPTVNAENFDLRLAADHPQSHLFETIRKLTPLSSILVMESSDLHIPTLTRRKLFAPPMQTHPQPGVGGITSLDLLAHVKGYGEPVLKQRRLIVSKLFDDSPDILQKERSLKSIYAVGRPIVLILENRRHLVLQGWLNMNGKNSCLFNDGKMSVWVID